LLLQAVSVSGPFGQPSTGGGRVTSDPAGIDCNDASSCTLNPFSANTKLTLTAHAAPGYTFIGWADHLSRKDSCDELKTITCHVTMDSDKHIRAFFVETAYLFHNLNVSKTEGGFISSNESNEDGDKIACGRTCDLNYSRDSKVTLKATPINSSYRFIGWDGACSGSTDTCIVTIDGDKRVIANFVQDTFTVKVGYSGEGRITSYPNGIDCGNDCSKVFPFGTDVRLDMKLASGYTFTGWEGDACMGDVTPSCEITNVPADAVKSINAVFIKTNTPPRGSIAALDIHITGAGETIGSEYSHHCTGDCILGVTVGDGIALRARAYRGYRFAGWGGACSGTSSSCSVRMDAAKSLTVNFVPDTPSGTFPLQVAYQGEGSITSNPAGINCGTAATACSSVAFTDKTKVTLTAQPAAGYTFSHWEGACLGNRTCEVTMAEAKQVKAVFTQTTSVNFTLTASKTGNGSITGPNSLNCGTACTASYASGQKITLKAQPAAGHRFTGWGGACSGSLDTCDLTIDKATTVSATFVPNPPSTFALQVGYVGDGSITSNPAGINCGKECSKAFPVNTKVTLTAQPAAGYTFSHWEGACTGSGACEVTITAAKKVDAVFTLHTLPPSSVNFALDVSTTGNGKITSQPAGIDCGTSCSANYGAGTAVTLTATPATGHTFSGWSGDCSGTATCTVTMDKAKAVHAAFTAPTAPPPPPPVTPPTPVTPKTFALKVGYVGDGRITSQPAGIDCGASCQATYQEGERITLTATPAPGYHFVDWDGLCPGSTGTCTVTMDSVKFVDAIFAPNATSRFTLNVQGTTGGTVTSSPAGIDCIGQASGICARDFAAGTQVTLTVHPDPGYRFIGWSGACMGGTLTQNTCVVTLDAAQTVRTTFRAHNTNAHSCLNASFSQSENMIVDAYIAYYGRPPEAAGLAWWNTHTAGNFHAAMDAFGHSEEFLRRFGSMSKSNLIDNLYRQMFGRSAESGGLTFYSNRLGSGQQSLASISLDIFYGARNEDAQILENRRKVARHFAIKTRGQAGASPVSDVLLADWLSLVTEDSSTADDVCEMLTTRIDAGP